MARCEYCGKDHDEGYGSGRFCGSKCARGFSTKKNRKVISKKVSRKLKGSGHTFACLRCGKVVTKKKKGKYCTRVCSSRATNSDPDVRKRIRESRIASISRGNVGYGIKCEYEGIRCDSALEYAFVKQYKLNNPNAVIERFKGYLTLSNGKSYQPDFLIDGSVIVEVKYEKEESKALEQKWENYIKDQSLKKEALETYGKYLWVTNKDIGQSFYRECLNEVRAQSV